MDEETLFSTAGQDSTTGDIIIKTVNLAAHSIEARVDAGILQTEACIYTLRNTDALPKTKEASQCGGPDLYQGPIDLDKPYTFPSRSLTVMRIPGKNLKNKGLSGNR